jgi:hypothetical protein
MGELQEVLGKIMACEGPSAIYWDGSSLVPRLIEEMGDVKAALWFFAEHNLDETAHADIVQRHKIKAEKFDYWHHQHLRAGKEKRA